LTFFEKISRYYQENSQAKPKNITLVSINTRQVAKQASRISACYPDGFRLIFDLFSRKSQNFSEKLSSEFQKIPNLSIHFYLLATHVNAEFQLSTCYPDRLRQIFDLFQENFRFFQKTS
jgi:hypothetical protein